MKPYFHNWFIYSVWATQLPCGNRDRKESAAMGETQVLSLGREDPVEKEMATHLSILPGRSHGQRSLADYSPWGCKELHTTE